MVRGLGRAGIAAIHHTGRGGMFLVSLVGGMGMMVRRPRLLVQQIHAVGVMTLPIILVAGLFVGMMLGLQGYNTLVGFGAESSLGMAVGLLVGFLLVSGVLTAIQRFPVRDLDVTIDESKLGTFMADQFDVVIRGVKLIPGDWDDELDKLTN